MLYDVCASCCFKSALIGRKRFLPEGAVPGNNSDKRDADWQLLISAMNAGRREMVPSDKTIRRVLGSSAAVCYPYCISCV
jgi:hypothetical protein